MIGPDLSMPAPMASGAAHPMLSDTTPVAGHGAAPPSTGLSRSTGPAAAAEPILCGHCGRTASNGISCQGMCVADSGY